MRRGGLTPYASDSEVSNEPEIQRFGHDPVNYRKILS